MGVTSVAVAYGYGPMEELEAASPDYIASSVAELRALFVDEEELLRRKREAIKAKAAQDKAEREQGTAKKTSKPNSLQVIWKLIFPFLLSEIETALKSTLAISFKSTISESFNPKSELDNFLTSFLLEDLIKSNISSLVAF
jgi:hypothetical protein